jgi:hypothetical protein
MVCGPTQFALVGRFQENCRNDSGSLEVNGDSRTHHTRLYGVEGGRLVLSYVTAGTLVARAKGITDAI